MLTGLIGQAALRVLLVSVTAALAVHGMAVWTGRAGWRRAGRWMQLWVFVCAAIASAALIRLLLAGDYTYPYVAAYTGPGLPLVYRIAAFWGGNAGSLLFWSLVLTLYAAVAVHARHEDSDRMLPVVAVVLSCITLFYALLLNVAANPFVRTDHAVPPAGLNPLLQNPGMTVHPVNLYLGYIGFSIPFAYAIAGLWLGRTDSVWLKVTRRWTLVSWLFLSIGILYGAHWSYEELGWGGYWAWDPVENASLLPWLTATAFLHSAIVQEKRGLLKAWNVVLVSLTFLLTLFGTFLTRSGVLWSIHAFANAPLGAWFLSFLGLWAAVAAALIVWRWPQLRTQRRLEAVVSKESAFLLNNLLFLASAFAVLWGTLFPIVSEALGGRRMMVDAPFYNAVNMPLAVCVLFLMGVGPWVAWRRANLQGVGRALLAPLGAAVLVAAGAAALLEMAYHRGSILGSLAVAAAVFNLWTVAAEFVRGVRVRRMLTNDGPWRSLVRLVAQQRRRYGGYLVHAAVAVMAVGIAASGTCHLDAQVELAPGQSADLGGYHLTFTGMGVRPGTASRDLYANLTVEQRGRTLGVVQPSATFYNDGQQPTTNVALYSQPMQDLYVVLLGTSPDRGDVAIFDLHVNPLVQWIWVGGYGWIIGTLISLWPDGRRTKAAAEEPAGVDALYREMADLEYDRRMGKLDEAEYRARRASLWAAVEREERMAQALRARLERELEEDMRLARVGEGGAGG
ncbi:cytochrome c-type biogenesis CcmF C-terminal domain-containing protein [Alicyclobacillus sp.]|uniref:cytochrome c-type biogenesis CcmF C-terminal domain-containing protein n=1 Tax=Alicyclobacillus sp. TaxID=61169 RepID=UPI0025C179BE|nr:cytochrome c-type biogenesis CcmF C-terminal domain-containing protein [Alicyclobacillus sp.]MCL6515809.1 cytochrome c biogenesis protein CcsA [Alicyclobacillus sp.]